MPFLFGEHAPDSALDIFSPFPLAGGWAVFSFNANEIDAFVFQLTKSVTFKKCRIVTGSAVSAGATFTCGMYDRNGNQIFDCGLYDLNSGTTLGLENTIANPVTLPPGVYIQAWGCTSAAANLITGQSNQAARIWNANYSKISDQVLSAGRLPLSLGNLRAIALSLPCMMYSQ